MRGCLLAYFTPTCQLGPCPPNESSSGLKDSPEHIPGNNGYPLQGADALLGRGLLQARLDGVDGRVAQGPHGAADEPNEGGLPAGQAVALEVGLVGHEGLLEVGVGGEVDGLVGALAQGSETNTAVQRADALLLDDRIQRVRGVAVLGDVERVRQAVVLRLQPDLDDLHGRHHRHGLGHARRQPRQERRPPRHLARLLVRQHLLVGLERGEPDRHLGDNARHDGAEALVQAEGRLALDDVGAGEEEPALGGPWRPAAAGELHTDLDGVCCVAAGES